MGGVVTTTIFAGGLSVFTLAQILPGYYSMYETRYAERLKKNFEKDAQIN